MLNQLGKKGIDWVKERRLLVEELKKSGDYKVFGNEVFGICPDCNKYHKLTPDHIKKRSQGGLHNVSNIDWVCLQCHNLRDNMRDPKGKKQNSNKASWQTSHPCKKCKKIVSMLICPHCRNMSMPCQLY